MESRNRPLAVVTGAGSGIGRATTLLLAERGYAVVLIGRSFEKLNQTAQELSTPHWVMPCDLSDLTAIDKVSQNILQLHNQGHELSALINNAGIFMRGTVEETAPADYRKQWENNFLAPAILTQKLLKIFKDQKRGVIVNVSSTLGLHAVPETSAYAAAKAALQIFSQCLAAEVAPWNIRVNCICPGLVQTPIHGLEQMPASAREEALKQMHQAQPLGRMGKPQEIAELVHFLISDNGAWMTGSNIPIDGGISLT